MKIMKNTMRKMVAGMAWMLSCVSASVWAQGQMTSPAPAGSHYEVTLQGACIYADSWNTLPEGTVTPMGIYQMKQTESYEVKPFLINSAVYSNGGGAFLGNDFWFIWKQRDPTGQITLCQLEKLDLTTGTRTNLGVCSNDLMITTSGTAVDPTTGNVYGIFWDSENMQTRQLGIVDYPNGERTTIADISQALYALCCDTTGQLYAVTQAGKLVKVDKEDGMLTEVGNTGVKPYTLQAAAVDQYTNKMYWTAITKDGSEEKGALYEVDLATAQATKLADYPDRNEFTVLRVLNPKAKDDAPAPVTGLKALFDKASTKGTLSFELPMETFAGKTLSGQLTYRVTVDDEEVATGNGNAGQAMSVNLSTTTGLHEIVVTTSNDKGTSPAATLQKYTGYDKPLAPTDVKLAIDEQANKASISWTAPAALGENDGYVDVDGLTYNLVRHPDEKKIENVNGNSYVDVLEPTTVAMYSYDVVAVNHAHKGKPATSNAVMFGQGYNVPWQENFDSQSSLNLFTIIDSNHDGATWEWSRFKTKAIIYTYNDNNAADDWLITPPIAMEAGKKYKLSFDEHVTLPKYPERLEIKWGEGMNPDTYQEVMPKTLLTNETFETKSFVVTAPADGNYHFGFHVCSDAAQGLLYIDNLGVEFEAAATAPSVVTNIETHAADYGMNPVTITFNAPKKAINGKKLNSIDRIEVLRKDGSALHIFNAPTPGEQLSCQDENAAKGLNEYVIVAYNENGMGKRADATAFVGTDVPAAPQGIKVFGAEDGSLSMTWQTPEKGTHGGYINPSQLSYTAYSVNEYDEGQVFKQNIKGTEVSLADIDNSGDQRMTLFGVSASNKEGESDINASNSIVVGDAYKLPFVESFANGHLTYELWYTAASGKNAFVIDDKTASDNDGACVAFQAGEANAVASFCSGKIALDGCESPVLTFDYYGELGHENKLLAEINRAYIDTTTVKVIDFAQETTPSGWKHAVVNLSQFRFAPYIQLAFLCQIAQAGDEVKIDNIKIENNPALMVNAVQTETATQGELYTVTGVRVKRPLGKGIYIKDGKKICVDR